MGWSAYGGGNKMKNNRRSGQNKSMSAGICPACGGFLMARVNPFRERLNYEIWCSVYCCENRIESTFGSDRFDALRKIEAKTGKAHETKEEA